MYESVFMLSWKLSNVFSFLFAGAPESYQTFLETRPEQMEVDAIELVCDLCLKYKYTISRFCMSDCS